MKIGFFDCRSGISGDMMLGALVDAGVPLELLSHTTEQLGVGARLAAARVQRSGIGASKVDVIVPEADEQQRCYREIQALIEAAQVPSQARELAQRAFLRLGQAESKIHGVALEEVHFHEVGSVDAIVDIVVSAVGLSWLEVDQWSCSPLNLGSGSVRCQHGVYPVPAPATLEILQGAPVYSEGPTKELVTPTGAALLRALGVEFGPLPAMVLERAGYGAGTMDFPGYPNVVRLTLGASTLVPNHEQIAVIETALDDCTPQVLAYVSELLLEMGALDVYQTPITMKKGRAGILLTVLCPLHLAEKTQQLLFSQTTTIGLRCREQRRVVLARRSVAVDTEWGPISIKVASWSDGQPANAYPEYEECQRVARQFGIALRQVQERALQCYWGSR